MPTRTETTGLSVWIIEDDLELLAALSQALTSEGHRVLATSDLGADGASPTFESTPRLDPDVVLVDERLPSTSGIEVLRSLRTSGYRGPAVLMTAYAEEIDVARAREAGATEIVAKPFTLDRLLHSIEHAARAHGR